MGVVVDEIMSSDSVLKALSKIKCPSIRENKICRIPNCIFDHTLGNPNGEFRTQTHINPEARSGTEIKTETQTKEHVKTEIEQKVESDKESRTENDLESVPETKLETTIKPEKDIEAPLSAGPSTSVDTSIKDEVKKAIVLETASSSSPKVVRKLGQTAESTEQEQDPKRQKRPSQKAQRPQDIPLAPIPVIPFAPAQTATRVNFIKQLRKIYHSQIRSKTPTKDAVEKEYEIAKSTGNRTYDVTMKRTIYKMQKTAKPIHTPAAQEKQQAKDQLFQNLESLISSIKVLNQNKFVTEVPNLTNGEQKTAGKTRCDRCGVDFDTRKILESTRCRFHPERFSISRQTKGSYTSNDINSKFYPCCSKPMGESEGCQLNDHHVYKLDSAASLHSLIPFVSTENWTGTFKAIALDCEMGYTTFGFEMIRLTMMDFETEKVCYDWIIKPKGQVLDLNTYWSGVSEINDDNSITWEKMLADLQKLISKDTILIGHGLENDLNVMRLVHHRIVDTSILFPRGMRKRSLKDITFEFLSEKIQSGEHDSEEDARSCIKIVKWYIKKYKSNH